MTRLIAAATVAGLVLGVVTASAQTLSRPAARAAFPEGAIEGRVLDELQRPIAGAMVSVIGRATVVATTDRDGWFAFRDLPFGPYVLSVHSRGYWQSRGRTVQLTEKKISVPQIQLTRVAGDRAAAPPKVTAVSSPPQLAGFGVDMPTAQTAATEKSGGESADDAEDTGETAWRLRHLPRSVLKEASLGGVWTERPPSPVEAVNWLSRAAEASIATPIAFFNDLPLSGQVNLLTTDQFNGPGDLFAGNGTRSVAFVSVNTRAAGGAWAVQGAMTQGDLSSWIVAGSYKSIASNQHAYELGLSYSTQRYDGGNAAALAAMRDNARNVGAVYGFDEWTLSPRLVVGYGTGFARYDYLNQSGLWSPRFTLTLPMNGMRVKALASARAIAPGAEEFAPSVTGMWLPPERTFSTLAVNGVFRPEQTRHVQLSVERDIDAGVTVSLRGFAQHVDDQLVEMFGVDMPGRGVTPLGHYFVGTAGDIDVRGWGVSMVQEVPGYVRGTIQYTVATAYWLPTSTTGYIGAPRGLRGAGLTENVYDLQTTIEATVPQTSTRVLANYHINTAFWDGNADPLARPSSNSRFSVRVNQSLPFLRFSNADWEALVDIRDTFRDADIASSIYDEAMALRAPKRVVGGLLVRF